MDEVDAEPEMITMLCDDEASVMENGQDVNDLDVMKGEITVPNPAHDAIVDVLSFKGFARAIMSLRRTEKDAGVDFERALVRMINLNGAMARLVEDGRK